MEQHGLWFAEAPVPSEDVEGLAHVAQKVDTAIAVGEEWRTAYDAALRINKRACAMFGILISNGILISSS
jgi:L-alanine-DL-glutamate epimerase-like enolase superfamily enzyme